MIPVLGPRRRRAPRNASIQEVPGSIPGSAPNAPIFFAPGGYTPPKTPLCDREPRGTRIPSNAPAVLPGGTRQLHETPALVYCRDDESLETDKKYKPPKKLVLKVRKVLIFKVVVLPITFGRSVRERRLHL